MFKLAIKHRKVYKYVVPTSVESWLSLGLRLLKEKMELL